MASSHSTGGKRRGASRVLVSRSRVIRAFGSLVASRSATRRRDRCNREAPPA
jgi:hypothetical protein